MHIDRAPWAGWLRIAIASLQYLIFLTTITVIALGAASSALIQRQWNLPYLEQSGQTSLPETSYTSTHEMKVRIQLVCFYTLAPLITLASITTEAWCLLANDLAPFYVLLASPFSILIWSLELTFWTVCRNTSGSAVPNLCPAIFKYGKEELFTLSNLALAQASVYVAAAIIAFYLAYMAVGALVFHHERKRDKQRKWIGAQKRSSLSRFAADEEAAKEVTPMMQARASVAEGGGEQPRTVTWE